jgi:hypothetical protein
LALHTRKSPSHPRDGYRAHLVAEPGTGLITDEALSMAAGSDNADPALAQRFLANAQPVCAQPVCAASDEGASAAGPTRTATEAPVSCVKRSSGPGTGR